MASFNELEQLTATVELPVPRPVTIYLGMKLQDWKKHFAQMSNEATDPTTKIHYTKCLKTLMWGEFCNGSLSYVGNSKDSDGNLTFKFTFQFSDIHCRSLFQRDWKANVEIVTLH